MAIKKKIVVSGDVQGVGFRYLVRRNARKRKLSGDVKNMPDSSVQITVKGEKENIDRFINDIDLKDDPIYVDRIEVFETNAKVEDGFRIVVGSLKEEMIEGFSIGAVYLQSVREEVRSVGKDVKSVGKDVRSVREEVKSVGKDVKSVGKDVRSVREEVKSVGKDVRSVGKDVRSVREEVKSGREETRLLREDSNTNFASLDNKYHTVSEELKSINKNIERLVSNIETLVKDYVNQKNGRY